MKIEIDYFCLLPYKNEIEVKGVVDTVLGKYTQYTVEHFRIYSSLMQIPVGGWNKNLSWPFENNTDNSDSALQTSSERRWRLLRSHFCTVFQIEGIFFRRWYSVSYSGLLKVSAQRGHNSNFRIMQATMNFFVVIATVGFVANAFHMSGVNTNRRVRS